MPATVYDYVYHLADRVVSAEAGTIGNWVRATGASSKVARELNSDYVEFEDGEVYGNRMFTAIDRAWDDPDGYTRGRCQRYCQEVLDRYVLREEISDAAAEIMDQAGQIPAFKIKIEFRDLLADVQTDFTVLPTWGD